MVVGGLGTVLLVDDCASWRERLVPMLRRLGAEEIIEAGTLYDAIVIAHETQLGLVLTDVCLPNQIVNCIPLITEVRKSCPGAWVIAMSGLADRAVMAHLMHRVPDAFLGIPFDESELRECIESLPRLAAETFDAVVDARVGHEDLKAMQRRLRERAALTALERASGGVRRASRLLGVDPRYTRKLRADVAERANRATSGGGGRPHHAWT